MYIMSCKKQTPLQTLHHNMPPNEASSRQLISGFTIYRDIQLDINVQGVPDSKPWDGSLNIVVHGKHGDHAAVVFRKDTPEKNSPGTEHALTGDMWLLDLRHVDESGDKLNVYYARRDEIKYKKLIQLCGIKDVGFSIRHLAVQFT